VPGAAKVCENDAPLVRMPEFQPAASDVDVCEMAVGSQFTHTTLLPDLTWTVAGTNATDWMNTTVAPAAVGGATQSPVVVVASVVARPEKHAAMPRSATATDTVPRASAFQREKDR